MTAITPSDGAQNRQCPVVPADPWRRPLPRHLVGARESRSRYLAPDRAGGGRTRLFRRAAADRRSCEDSWIVASALAPSPAPALPRRRAPRPAIAGRRRADDRDPRPHPRRPPAHQCRHRRRSGREQGRRHFPRSRRALRGDRRIPPYLYRACWRARRSPSRARISTSRTASCCFRPSSRRGPPLYFGGSSPAGQRSPRKQCKKYLTWGEPPAQVAEKFAECARAPPRSGRNAQLRHPPACHRARDRRRGLGGGRQADRPCRRGDHRGGAKGFRARGFGRPAAHVRAASGQPRTTRDQPESLGRRRPRARRRRHGPGRGPRYGGAAHARIYRAPGSIRSSCPAIRISKKPIASPSLCCPACRWRRRPSRPAPRRPIAAPSARSSATPSPRPAPARPERAAPPGRSARPDRVKSGRACA